MCLTPSPARSYHWPVIWLRGRHSTSSLVPKNRFRGREPHGGVHFTVRLGDDDRLCVLVIVGVRTDGTKELVAIADGYPESTESWAELLRWHERRC